MKAGRKPLDSTKEKQEGPIFSEEEASAFFDNTRQEVKQLSLVESQRIAAVRAVAQQVGYQLPADCVDPDLIQRDISSNMRRTAEAMLQVGLGLIVLKEACQHGEFTARLEVLGFEPTVARRYMQVARKLSNHATSRVLLNAAASQSKLLELIVLDEEQIEELELTGQTGELKLDDVATMSVKELRAKVRELKEENKAKENRIAVKSRQLDEAEEKLERRKFIPPDQELIELQASATRQMNEAIGVLQGVFRGSLQDIADHQREHDMDCNAFMSGLVRQIQHELTMVNDTFMLDGAKPAPPPEWVTDPHFKDFDPNNAVPPAH